MITIAAAAILCGWVAHAEKFSLAEPGAGTQKEYAVATAVPALLPAPAVFFAYPEQKYRVNIENISLQRDLPPGFCEEFEFRLQKEKNEFRRWIFLFNFQREDYINYLQLSGRPLEQQYEILKLMLEKKRQVMLDE